MIAGAELWVDLGCGAGLAAAEALDGARAARALLVDVDADAAQEAARTVPAESPTALRADLADAEGLASLTDAIGDAGGVITCFEVVEHLTTFIPLVELLIEL